MFSTVTPAMLAVALGQAAPTAGSVTEQQWQMWIDDASMLIESRQILLGVETLEQAKIDYVIREAVVAHIKRPDDATQVTIAVDDGSSSRSYQSGKGRVTILDEWWTLLGLVEASGAFSIDAVPFGSAHLAWCSLMLGATYCSCGVDIAGVPIYEGGGL
jgi:hypothetical protein